MSDQIPTTTQFYSGWPELAIDERALAKFSLELSARLDEMEHRFAEPRRNPRLIFGEARAVSRRPR